MSGIFPDLNKIADNIDKVLTVGITETGEKIDSLIKNGRDVTINAENIIHAGISDTLSTAQFGIFALLVVGFYFISKSNNDKVADAIIQPSKTIREIAKKF